MTPLKTESRPLSLPEKVLQLVIILSATITFGYIFYFISQFLSDAIWGTSIVNIENHNALTNNELWAYRLSQLFYQLGTFLLTPLFFVLIIKKKALTYLGLDKSIKQSKLPWVFVLLVLSIFASSYLYDALSFYNWPQEVLDTEESAKVLMEQLLPASGFGIILLNIFMFVVMPAFVEEIYFRGMLQTVLKNTMGDAHIAILISSFLFAAVHGNMSGILAYWMMGLVLGYLFYLTGSLWYSILFHFLNNGITLFLDWLYRSDKIDVDVNDASVPAFIGILCVLLIVAILYKLNKQKTLPRLRVAKEKPQVAWVKLYESADLIKLQMVCDQLLEEGYDAAIMNKRDSAYGFGSGEIHVPIHQLESALSFIQKLNI